MQAENDTVHVMLELLHEPRQYNNVIGGNIQSDPASICTTELKLTRQALQ